MYTKVNYTKHKLDVRQSQTVAYPAISLAAC